MGCHCPCRQAKRLKRPVSAPTKGERVRPDISIAVYWSIGRDSMAKSGGEVLKRKKKRHTPTHSTWGSQQPTNLLQLFLIPRRSLTYLSAPALCNTAGEE
jgi:hypothetical protein